MRDDICGCEVSLVDLSALDAWNDLVRAILAHSQSAPVHLGKLIDLAPEFAMAHAVKGLSALMLGRRELVAAAQDANADAARQLTLHGGTPRERLWCEALNSWLAGDPRDAIAAMERAMKANPHDTISMKMSHGIRFILGDNHGMLRSVQNVIGAHEDGHALRGYALGCLSFALEETGHYAQAERLGRAGLRYAADDAWGLHAVTHVYDMTHRTKAGLELIDDNAAAWAHCNNFRFHVWWHKALLHLDLGEHDTVLALYDDKIRNEKTDDYRDFSNASSLLMRLELEGVAVGDRWDELATLAEARSTDGCLAFADLHYMLALVGDGRQDAATQMIARVARDSDGSDHMATVMKDPGISASTGLALFGEGQYANAFAHLAQAHTRFQSLGGSHAQRDVFDRITIEAGIRAGQLEQAKALLEQRTVQRAGARDHFAQSRFEMIERATAAMTAQAAE